MQLRRVVYGLLQRPAMLAKKTKWSMKMLELLYAIDHIFPVMLKNFKTFFFFPFLKKILR